MPYKSVHTLSVPMAYVDHQDSLDISDPNITLFVVMRWNPVELQFVPRGFPVCTINRTTEHFAVVYNLDYYSIS